LITTTTTAPGRRRSVRPGKERSSRSRRPAGTGTSVQLLGGFARAGVASTAAAGEAKQQLQLQVRTAAMATIAQDEDVSRM
jgi:hypothetical protein